MCHGQRTGKSGVGAVSASPLGSVLSQVNSAPGKFLPFFAPNRDIVCGKLCWGIGVGEKVMLCPQLCFLRREKEKVPAELDSPPWRGLLLSGIRARTLSCAKIEVIFGS